MFPVRCVGCGAAALLGLCQECLSGLEPSRAEPPPRGVEEWWSPYDYAGAWRDVVVAVKARRARALVALLAGALVECVGTGLAAFPGTHPDVVTWPPTTSRRRLRRGYDPAELLARTVTRFRMCPVARLLVRDRDAPAQMGRGRRARRRGPCFTANRSLAGLTVLVVDDVSTTGATITASADALHRAGAASVLAATAARTPRPQGTRGER